MASGEQTKGYRDGGVDYVERDRGGPAGDGSILPDELAAVRVIAAFLGTHPAGIICACRAPLPVGHSGRAFGGTVWPQGSSITPCCWPCRQAYCYADSETDCCRVTGERIGSSAIYTAEDANAVPPGVWLPCEVIPQKNIGPNGIRIETMSRVSVKPSSD